MKLSFDIMGHEGKLADAIKAARKFKHKHNDVELILVGDKKQIDPLVKQNEFEILDCVDTIKMTDSPLAALRKTNSSMYQAMKLVADHKADGVFSAGSTQCFVSLVYYLIKPIKQTLKPCFLPFIPTLKNIPMGMCDVGAQINCDGKDIYNFAKMTKIYFESALNRTNPRIGLINIGTEDCKGHDYHKQANELLTNDKSFNYVGFIEPRYIFDGIVDIAVCDGYTGNLVLKSIEGGAGAVSTAFKKQYKKPWNWLGALFSSIAITKVKHTFDYRNHAGAVVLGINAAAVKTHGSADFKQFYSGLNTLYDLVKSNVIDKIKKEFQ